MSEADLSSVLAELKALREEVQRLSAPASPAVTVPQAEVMLGCSRARVFELLAQGVLEAASKAGRKRMITRDSVIRYLALPTGPWKPLPRRKRAKPRAKVENDLQAAISAL